MLVLHFALWIFSPASVDEHLPSQLTYNKHLS